MNAIKNVILNKKIVADTWQLVCENDALPALLDTTGNLIVPLAFWLTHRSALAQRAGKTGVWLKGPDDPAQLRLDGAELDLPLIAVEFAQFVDGRGYSTGRLLRERYGFTGELRAFGDVFRDLLPALTRCGFNSFALKEGKSLEDALHAFDDFSDAYQNAVDQPVPYYRRRLAATTA
jgi:uncharacterized protein (DUF934 family)